MADRMSDLFSFNPRRNIKGLFGDYSTRNEYGTLNPEQAALTRTLGPYLQNRISQGVKPYEGQLTEPISSGETNAIDKYNRLAALGNSSLGNLIQGAGPEFDTQFNTEVADPTLRYYQQYIQPLVEEEYAGPGSAYYGSARAEAVRRSLGDVSDSLLTQRFTAREAAKNRSIDAVRAANELGTTSTSLNAVPREIAQAGLDRQYNEFIRQSKESRDDLNAILDFLGVSTVTERDDPTLDRVISLIGAGANVLGALNRPR